MFTQLSKGILIVFNQVKCGLVRPGVSNESTWVDRTGRMATSCECGVVRGEVVGFSWSKWSKAEVSLGEAVHVYKTIQVLPTRIKPKQAQNRSSRWGGNP